MHESSEWFRRIRTSPRWWLMAAGAGLLLALLLVSRRGSDRGGNGVSFAARRGPLDITVIEGGSAQALESQEIKCEVRVGYQGLKILKIVEEGYQVTEDDIRTNKVLVELDSSDLQKQITQQDIQYEQAAASLVDAQQAYEIQINQNLSDIKAAEQKARFARMDFDKFLGATAAQEVIEKLGLERELADQQTNAAARLAAVTSAVAGDHPQPAASGSADTPPGATNLASANVVRAVEFAADAEMPRRAAASTSTNPLPASRIPLPSIPAPPTVEPLPASAGVGIDFSPYADLARLGDGEAKQKLRKLEDDLQLAKKELNQAIATREGTRRLFENGFVTKIDMERDEIANENSRLKVQTADTARDLFLKYEFLKTAEESLSKYSEAVRELVRARKAAISKLAQTEAKLKSAQGQFNIQTRQRKELDEQLDKCVLTAKKPGLVVYGGGRDEFYWGGEERIREGATVRERQAIITIPDMSKMSVRVKIHESYIKKVKKGQKARVTVDAFPDKALEGEVTKVGVLPDSQNRWMNPDLKVYLTTISIQGTNESLKPGMSAKVEIVVDRLDDVVYVPIQAVSPFEGGHVCWIAHGGTPERRAVTIGEFNDEFMEIKSGLKEGERVLLKPAETPAPSGKEEDAAPQPERRNPPSQPSAPPARMSKA